MSSQFISIPKNGFTIFIGSRIFLSEAVAVVPTKIRQGVILYIHHEEIPPLYHPSGIERYRIEFRPERNIIDIIAMLESHPARFVIIEHFPGWFAHNEEYIGPFGFVCRERSKNRQEVLLISVLVDTALSELESMVDKLAYIQDILVSPHNLPCDVSQATLGDISTVPGPHPMVPVTVHGQQHLVL